MVLTCSVKKQRRRLPGRCVLEPEMDALSWAVASLSSTAPAKPEEEPTALWTSAVLAVLFLRPSSLESPFLAVEVLELSVLKPRTEAGRDVS